jgi:hypothetical protein
MKYAKDYIKQLDERYKSTADNGLWETWITLYEAFDPGIDDLIYAVIIRQTFDDGVDTYDKCKDGEIFNTLAEAQEYFSSKTEGMYRSPEEEFLAAFKSLKPKSNTAEDSETAWANLLCSDQEDKDVQ